jgi:hypothetical protein
MRIFAPGLLCLVFTGCLPYYGPIDDSGQGYRDIELSPRIYRVDFHYNGQPLFRYRGPRFEELVLLRAADLTRENGYRYFIVDTTALPGASFGKRSLIVKVFHEPPSAEGVKVYDANEISSELRGLHPYLKESDPGVASSP